VNEGWALFSVPRDTPVEIVATLSAALETAMQEQRLQEYRASNGQMSLAHYRPEEIAQFVSDKNAKYLGVVEAARIQID